MSVLLQDLRYAARVLVRAPGFTAVAVITMALGIGANTTIFSLTNATLLRAPEAIRDPDRVVQVGRDRPDEGFDNMSYVWFELFRDRISGLESLAAYTPRAMVLGRGSAVEVLAGQLVTGEYFTTLGVNAIAGRTLGPGDDTQLDANPAAVISHALWQRRYAGDPEIVGSQIRLNGADLQLIGVIEPGFRGTDVVGPSTDVWVPLTMAGTILGPQYREYEDFGFSWLWMVGRLAEGATRASLASELDALYRPAFLAQWGEEPRHRIGVIAGVGLRPEERRQIAQIMTLLTAIAAIVLVVACANLANLLLARGVARSQELGIRAALGAGRTRLLRQLLTESILLALAGGAIAFLLTFWTARLIPDLLPINLGVGLSPDLSVLGFATAASLVAGVIFGVVPALRVSRGDLIDSLREASPLGGSRGGWLRSGMVVAQLSLAFVLLAATGLLAQSLARASAADPGYSTRELMTATLDLDMAGYDESRGRAFVDELARRAASLPGVEAVGHGSNLPFAGWSRQSVYWPQPRPDLEREFIEIDTATVSPGYFEALRIPLVSGSPFGDATSSSDSLPAVLVSESAARLLWPGEPAVGQLLPLSEHRAAAESLLVVGVVGDVQVRSLQQPPRPSIYLPAKQRYNGRTHIFVRTTGDPTSIARPLRSLIEALDPDLGILQMGALNDRMGRSLQQTLMVARLGGIFGVLAIFLASVGLYGVVSYLASSRRHEVGVRMALGARRGDVLGLFVRQAVTITAVGVIVGSALTLAAGGALASLLYGVSPRDPLTLTGIAAAVVALAIVAALVPARRASGLNPVAALRQK